MLYSDLRFPDTDDNDNLIVTLTISDSGIEFTNTTLATIVTYLEEDYCKGLAIRGCSLEYSNIKSIHDLLQTLRAIFGNSKSIVLYTHYSISEISSMRDLLVDEILRYVDFIK